MKVEGTNYGKQDSNNPHAHRIDGQRHVVHWLDDSAHLGVWRVVCFEREDLTHSMVVCAVLLLGHSQLLRAQGLSTS